MVGHAMICERREFVIQRHNERRDWEAELLNTVCSHVKVSRGANLAQDIKLDIRARGF